MHEFAFCAKLVRNTRQAELALGLSLHPSRTNRRVRPKRIDSDTLVRKVIYHADPHTLYTLEPPELAMKDDEEEIALARAFMEDQGEADDDGDQPDGEGNDGDGSGPGAEFGDGNSAGQSDDTAGNGAAGPPAGEI